jgi:methylenetetrahydrofolate dehydrogenase (NADP+) / methenyltetrahydrofolate cyclohydrolase
VSPAVSAAIWRGTEPAAEIRGEVRARFERLRERGVIPGLAVVTVGEPPAGNPYVRAKCRAAEEVGARAVVSRLPARTPEGELRERLRALSADPAIHGVILQLPLPEHLSEERHLEDLDPLKDVDGLHPLNVGRWVHGLPAHRPATPLGVLELLRRYAGDLTGRHVVVLGRSRIVGRPLSIFLSQRDPGGNATVTLCHSHTRDLPSVTQQADVLVVAIGRPRAIGAAHVRAGAAVIDVGIHPVADPTAARPRYVGDVDFDAVREIAGAITPVPGGVGPMTVAMLLRNLADAAEAGTDLR